MSRNEEDSAGAGAAASETEQAAEAEAKPAKASDLRGRMIAVGLLLLFLLVTHLTQGVRSYHIALAAICALTALLGGRAFRFLVLIAPCALTGVIYDSFRLITSLRGEIHIADLYNAELSLFGVTVGEGAAAKELVPADYLLLHTHPFLDLTSGLVYILYLYVPIVTAIALFFIDQRRMMMVGWAFFATNLLGMIIYLAYPAAPPWYVAKYGLGPAVLDALPSAAGAVRFDQLVGVDYFTEYYKRSANVFGAMPSLHCGYPMSTMVAMWGSRKRWIIPLAGFSLYVSFAAIYLQHHYILDVLAGALTALCGALVVRRLIPRTATYRSLSTPAG